MTTAWTSGGTSKAEVPDERRRFETFVRLHGSMRPVKRVAPTKVGLDGDCWKAAWEEAQRIGGRYVEGFCYLPGHTDTPDEPSTRRVRAHAWVEVDTDDGPAIVECTRGFERAHRYFGVDVNCEPGSIPDRSTRRWLTGRASVIEAMCLAGMSRDHIARSI